MIKNNTHLPTLKEIETDLFRLLQETYGDVLSQLLMNFDSEIAQTEIRSDSSRRRSAQL